MRLEQNGKKGTGQNGISDTHEQMKKPAITHIDHFYIQLTSSLLNKQSHYKLYRSTQISMNSIGFGSLWSSFTNLLRTVLYMPKRSIALQPGATSNAKCTQKDTDNQNQESISNPQLSNNLIDMQKKDKMINSHAPAHPKNVSKRAPKKKGRIISYKQFLQDCSSQIQNSCQHQGQLQAKEYSKKQRLKLKKIEKQLKFVNEVGQQLSSIDAKSQKYDSDSQIQLLRKLEESPKTVISLQAKITKSKSDDGPNPFKRRKLHIQVAFADEQQNVKISCNSSQSQIDDLNLFKHRPKQASLAQIDAN